MEAILDFGRGRQKWLKSCSGEYVGGGGGGPEMKHQQLPPLSHLDGGGGEGGGVEVALQLFAFLIYVVLLLVPLSPFSILL
jgi:hypothetical protein